MLINISMKFLEDILNGFQLQSGHDFSTETATYKVQRGITQTIYIQEVWFLLSAHLLILVNISMTFHEDILNDFQVTEL